LARKDKHKKHAPQAPATAARVEKALSEGRTQQALELARTLHKQEPTPAHQELLRRATLDRARHLRSVGYARDALTVLENAVHLGDGADYLEQVALEMARCGEPGRALVIAEKLPGTPVAAKVLGHAADQAVPAGPAGAAKLPEAVRPQLGLVLQAFALAEQGKDDEARAALQGIGLQSPFLEWKLMLRGLMAYHAGEDERAVENWQRLSPDRLPARLAAPLRFVIDGAFRAAQAPETQAALQAQTDQLHSSPLVMALRGLQLDLANAERIEAALRKAERVVPLLKQEAPRLLPRLAACFFWAIVDHGYAEDVPRFRRLFGAPPDDPKLARLEALALERRNLHSQAHKFWQEFEKSVAATPAAWPPGQADHVRALVWRHMAENAAAVPDINELRETLGPMPFFDGELPKPLKPSAEECYQRSLELAPDQLDTHYELFEHLRDKDRAGKAEQAARKLLKRFPDHAPTLEGLADLLMEKEKYAEALEMVERALKANPLERRLRDKLGLAVMYDARAKAEDGRYDEARAGYERALALEEAGRKYPVLCKWAACEFKAGNAARGEELLAQAHAEGGNQLAVAFNMLVEAVRFKLAPALKKRFDQEVKERLAEPPTGQAAAAIADTMGSLKRAGVKYHGQGAHEKKALDYLKKAIKADFTEQQMGRVCVALEVLKKPRLLADYFRAGRKRFPTSPTFYILEARYNILQGPGRCDLYGTRHLVDRARQLVEAQPHSPQRQETLALLDGMAQELERLHPFASLFGGGGGFIDPFDDGYDDEDDYY
jgi:tetratricopeptide (TPR) repeat protein